MVKLVGLDQLPRTLATQAQLVKRPTLIARQHDREIYRNAV